MPIVCFCAGCNSGSRKDKDERQRKGEKVPSLHRVPNDPELFEMWKNAIPLPHMNRELRISDRICSLHFKESDIDDHYEETLRGGEIWRYPKKPVLREGAVPSIFPSESGKKENVATEKINPTKTNNSKKRSCTDDQSGASNSSLNSPAERNKYRAIAPRLDTNVIQSIEIIPVSPTLRNISNDNKQPQKSPVISSVKRNPRVIQSAHSIHPVRRKTGSIKMLRFSGIRPSMIYNVKVKPQSTIQNDSNVKQNSQNTPMISTVENISSAKIKSESSPVVITVRNSENIQSQNTPDVDTVQDIPNENFPQSEISPDVSSAEEIISADDTTPVVMSTYDNLKSMLCKVDRKHWTTTIGDNFISLLLWNAYRVEKWIVFKENLDIQVFLKGKLMTVSSEWTVSSLKDVYKMLEIVERSIICEGTHEKCLGCVDGSYYSRRSNLCKKCRKNKKVKKDTAKFTQVSLAEQEKPLSQLFGIKTETTAAEDIINLMYEMM